MGQYRDRALYASTTLHRRSGSSDRQGGFYPDDAWRSDVQRRRLFTGFTAGGVDTDLTAAPHYGASQFRADGVTEVRAEMIAENCGVNAVVSQFTAGATISPGDSIDAASQTRSVIFILPANGTTKYQHIVKVFAGGRSVSEQEAVDTARSNASRFGLDLTALQMKITTDAAP
jgi:hypothetical protein